MATPLLSLYTLSFLLALLATFFVVATLRLLYILPHSPFRPHPLRRRPIATRILIVLGSGGHTHEMFYILRNLDTRKYTHRTYVVSSGDAFSAQRAAEFEASLEAQEKKRQEASSPSADDVAASHLTRKRNGAAATTTKAGAASHRPACVGADHYNIAVVPRARKIHQPLLTTPLSALWCLVRCFVPLLAAPPLLPHQPPQTPYDAAAQDLPDMIITNGPATAVIVVLASLVLRFFDVRGANSRGKCRTIYVESFARVKTLSLSGKLLLRVVDRFLVQWKELKGKGGGKAEFWGMLV